MTNKYLNDQCKIALPWPTFISYPSYGAVPAVSPPAPRLIFGRDASMTQVEIWCISDLLSKFPNTPAYQSSSQRKMGVLADGFSYDALPISLVVAVGTASSGPFCRVWTSDGAEGSRRVSTIVDVGDV